VAQNIKTNFLLLRNIAKLHDADDIQAKTQALNMNRHLFRVEFKLLPL
jgi:hypothetical protein